MSINVKKKVVPGDARTNRGDGLERKSLYPPDLQDHLQKSIYEQATSRRPDLTRDVPLPRHTRDVPPYPPKLQAYLQEHAQQQQATSVRLEAPPLHEEVEPRKPDLTRDVPPPRHTRDVPTYPPGLREHIARTQALDIQQLKPRMSHVFRNHGYIQMLSEEGTALATIDRTMAHPELREGLWNMLHRDIPAHHPSNPDYNGSLYCLHVQTARAYTYAYKYNEAMKNRGDRSEVEIAREAMRETEAMKGQISENAYDILFLKTHKDTAREQAMRIDVGAASPPKRWGAMEHAEERASIEHIIQSAGLRENLEQRWQECKSYSNSHTRENIYNRWR
jgi:hypothetical protein